MVCGFGLIINQTAEKPPRKTVYHHMTAQFGVQNFEARYTRNGPLVQIEPENGCLPIKNKGELKGAIVLVKRGGSCNYFNKSIAVEKYGGVGMVVGNDVNQNSLVWMISESWEVEHPQIPCVFVYKSTYDSALAVIEEELNGTVIATISLEGDVPPPSIWTFQDLEQIMRYLLIVFPIIWAILAIKYFCRHNREPPRVRRRLRHIPEVLFTKDLLVKARAKSKVISGCQKNSRVRLTNSICPICLDEFQNQTKIKLLPCDHGFHSECIGPWIADHSDSCPICRQSVTDRIVSIEWYSCFQCCLLSRASRENELRQPLIEPGVEGNEHHDEAPVVVNQENVDRIMIFSEPGQANYTSVNNENH